MPDEFIELIRNQYDNAEDALILADTCFRDVPGWDSIVGLGLITAFADKYGVAVSADQIRGAHTIADLYELVSQNNKRTGHGTFVTRPLVDATYNDAKQVVLSRFNKDAVSVLDMTMANPLRANDPEIGDVIYWKGCPVCFRAANRRKLYFRGRPLLGSVRGLTCIKRDAPAEALVVLREVQANRSRGCSIAYSNSQCLETDRMARASHATPGPRSCTRFLWRPIRPFACLAYFFRRKVLKLPMPCWRAYSTLEDADIQVEYKGFVVRRFLDFDPNFFDVLMEEYLKCNVGLVSSRSAEELRWVYGSRVKSGRVVVLGAIRRSQPCGFVVLKTDQFARRWMLMDWFAIRNDEMILGMLLDVSIRFLKERTPAIMLETYGFEQRVQHLLQSRLWLRRPYGCNAVSYNFFDQKLENEFKVGVGADDWFWGPWDGDVCMC